MQNYQGSACSLFADARSRHDKVVDNLNVLTHNSNTMSMAVCSFLNQWSDVMSSQSSQKMPTLPSPEPVWHVCTADCPIYCEKVYDD